MLKKTFIRKYAVMTVIATSVALAGCSDDDDDGPSVEDSTVPAEDGGVPIDSTTGTDTSPAGGPGSTPATDPDAVPVADPDAVDGTGPADVPATDPVEGADPAAVPGTDPVDGTDPAATPGTGPVDGTDPAATPGTNPDDVEGAEPDPDAAPVVEATPGEGNTALDFVVNSDNHNTLESLITSNVDLLNKLDNPNSQYTIFAPTDAAIDALDEETRNALQDPANAKVLERVLLNHVLEGSVQSMAVIEGVSGATEETPFTLTTLADAAPAQSLTFTANEEGNGEYNITDGMGNTVPLTGPLDQNAPTEVDAQPTGIVHVIENVLMPVPADALEDEDAGDESEEGIPDADSDPEASGGAADQALSDAGNFSIVRSSLDSAFPGELDAQAWTAFLPTDSVLAEAGISENLSAEQLQNHIVSSGVIDPSALQELNAITTTSGKEFQVETVDGTISVGGFVVESIATLSGGSQIYRINGVLQ